MKYFLNETTNEIFVFKLDGSEDSFIPQGLEVITKEHADLIIKDKLQKEEALSNDRKLTLDESIFKRNMLLLQSDWTQLPDIAEVIKNKWVPYRQELRDITLQTDFPDNIIWPVKPV